MQIERNSKRILARLRREGWLDVGAAGSHHKMRQPQSGKIVIVPHSKKDLPIGTARSIAKHVGWI